MNCIAFNAKLVQEEKNRNVLTCSSVHLGSLSFSCMKDICSSNLVFFLYGMQEQYHSKMTVWHYLMLLHADTKLLNVK